MSMAMDEAKIKALALGLAKDIKTPEDMGALSAQLTKITVEAASGAEMEDHLGYAPNQVAGSKSKNSRNGYSRKTLKGDPW